MAFNAKEYWNTRLNEQFTLKGVGYVTFSDRYNDWLYNRKKQVLDKLFSKQLADLKGKKVLDIGCGTGFFVEKYINKGAAVSGADITTKSIEELTKKFPMASFHLLDLGDKEGVVSQQFDVINMWDVMYHLVDDSEFRQACKNIGAMSKPGTYFIVTDFFGSKKEVRPAEHVTFRCIAQYEEALGAEGYKLKQVLPLYRFLNRHYRWSDRITNLIASFLCFLDNNNSRIMPNNISVSIWKFEK